MVVSRPRVIWFALPFSLFALVLAHSRGPSAQTAAPNQGPRPRPAQSFQTDTVLGLPKVEILFTDPEEALEKNRPVRIEREAKYLKRWEVWLLQEHNLYYEGGDTVVSLRRVNGDVAVTFPLMIGPIVISESQKRILDCGISAHTMVEFAILYGATGSAIRKLPMLTHTRDCGKTNDERLFWLHYSTVEDGVPVSIIRFVDANGNVVHQAKRRRAGTVSFKHKSRLYTMTFPEADYPN